MSKEKQIQIKGIKDYYIQDIMRKLYSLIVNYVSDKQKQQDINYLNTQPLDGKKGIFCDILEQIKEGSARIEKFIYGIKVVNGNLYIALENCDKEEVWTEKQFKDEKNWILFLEAKNNIVTFPTLLCLADCIEQY